MEKLKKSEALNDPMRKSDECVFLLGLNLWRWAPRVDTNKIVCRRVYSMFLKSGLLPPPHEITEFRRFWLPAAADVLGCGAHHTPLQRAIPISWPVVARGELAWAAAEQQNVVPFRVFYRTSNAKSSKRYGRSNSASRPLC